MPSFFRRLITALSWKTLRRVHKDRRARAQLAWVVLVLAGVLYELAILVFNILVFRENGRTNIAWSLAPLVVCAVVIGAVVLYRRRKPVQQAGPLTLDLTEYPQVADLPEVQATPELLRQFRELALLHAILVHRAASEGFLKLRGIPEGKQIITRQNHLRLLRDYDMLDRLGSAERDLLLAPDGAWDEDTIDRVTLLLEPVRVFRWLLRIDPLLPLIGEVQLIDFPLAADLLEDPKRLFADRGLAPIDDIRTARGGAEKIFYRCYSEGQRRGFFIDADAEHAEQAIFYAERLVGQESEDLLLGNIIVSRASDDGVRLAASLALARIRFLRWVQERLYGTVDAEPKLTAFL